MLVTRPHSVKVAQGRLIKVRAGDCLAYRGRFDEALHFAEEALRTSEARHILSWLPAAASTFGWIMAWAGRADEGLPLLERSVSLHESLGLNALLSLSYRRWAEGLYLAGRPKDAEGVAQRALDLARRFGERGVAAEVLLTLGEIVEAIDATEHSRADDLYARAGEEGEALDMRPLIARAHLRRGQLWRERPSVTTGASTLPSPRACSKRWTCATGRVRPERTARRSVSVGTCRRIEKHHTAWPGGVGGPFRGPPSI